MPGKENMGIWWEMRLDRERGSDPVQFVGLINEFHLG
jgi:hypothetical protein